MDMCKEIEMDNEVLCGASAYDRKFYMNEAFDQLPATVKDELKIACVIFVEDVGGILTLEFDEDGSLMIKTGADEGDLLYDEIGAALKVKALQNEKAELFQTLELFYKVFILGEDVE